MRPEGATAVSGAGWGTGTYPEDEAERVFPPEGEFVSFSVGEGHICGVRKGGMVDCWGWDEYGQATAPEGEFVSVSAPAQSTRAGWRRVERWPVGGTMSMGKPRRRGGVLIGERGRVSYVRGKGGWGYRLLGG